MNKCVIKLGLIVQKLAETFGRDRIVLNYLNYPTRKKRVNLHWAPIRHKKWGAFIVWNPEEPQNLGDFLANPIYKYMLKYYNLSVDKKLKHTVHLYTVGSIILLGRQNAVIWGSGLLRTEQKDYQWKRNTYRKLDIRCVRGPETERRLKENGYDVSKCVWGDPGLLMPFIYKPNEWVEKREYSVIVHMTEKLKVENQINIVTDNWREAIDQIYNSKLIISSSLHGIILAEAYGVPAILLDKIQFNDLFKYNDYYYSTGRKEYPICKTVEEALAMPKPKVPDISRLQQNLIKSFPADLWD